MHVDVGELYTTHGIWHTLSPASMNKPYKPQSFVMARRIVRLVLQEGSELSDADYEKAAW